VTQTTPNDVPSAPRIPDLFIVGAAKSGTTSLYHWLAGHPQVFMSEIKEPNYFAPDLSAEGRHTLRHPDDWDEYLALFSNANGALRAGEASVRYLYSTVAASLIAQVQPQPRIVVALRNPVEMAYSLYLHRRAQGSEFLATFEEAIAAEDDRHAGRRIPQGTNPRLGTYLDRARYGDQLARWIEAFGAERIHAIVFEEMVREPAPIFRAALQFLQVDPDYRPDEFRAYNPAHRERATIVRRIAAHPVAQSIAWGPLKSLLGEGRTRSLAARFRRSDVFRQKMERPELGPRTRAQLIDYFAPDVARTSTLLGRDLAAEWFAK
jgi:Sulfotransferase family